MPADARLRKLSHFEKRIDEHSRNPGEADKLLPVEIAATRPHNQVKLRPTAQILKHIHRLPWMQGRSGATTSDTPDSSLRSVCAISHTPLEVNPCRNSIISLAISKNYSLVEALSKSRGFKLKLKKWFAMQ